MTDEDFIGYLLDLLDPGDRAEVEAHLTAHPAAAARVERLRLALAPLKADREPDEPPAGLALRTLGRLAAYLVEHEPRRQGPAGRPAEAAADTTPDLPPLRAARRAAPPTDPEARFVGGRFRAELFVAAGIALVAFGLVLSGVNRARYQQRVTACQNNMQVLYRGLSGYSETHDRNFPQVGVEGRPTAGTYIAALADAGQLPHGFNLTCPADPTIGYAYTLGYRGPTGELFGLRQSDDPGADNDLIPISADYPSREACPGSGPASPHQRVMNVLFVGGNVRPTYTALVGPGGDDIYRNRNGQVSAGVDRTDAVLGRAGDRP
jgi:hypothetical protein